jgi:peroxiredoxin
MNSRTRFAWFLVLVFVLTFDHSGTAADKFKPFKLKTLDGTTKTLQDLAGKATLVSFFFPSCKFCNAEFPHTQKIYDKYKDQGLAAVWINVVPEENKRIAGWREQHRYTIPVLIGASQASLMRDYKLQLTPTHYLLDGQGNVVFTRTGYKEGDELTLEKEIHKVLGGQSVQ